MRRFLLPAAILILAATGVTALGRGLLDRSAAAPPAAAAVSPAVGAVGPAAGAANPGAAAAAPAELTTGPLMDSSPPARLAIPALRVSVPLIGLGRQDDGSMEVPADAKTVGWYTKAPTPGALGPAVLAGHVDYRKQPGTFARLAELRAGDGVDITRTDGRMAMFTVTRVDRYPKNAFPSDAVYGPIDHAGLRLITCGGDFDARSGHYADNIVVYARLTGAH